MKRVIFAVFILCLVLGLILVFAIYQKDKRDWLAADLHVHSNRSDGGLSPKDIIKIYENNDYAVLAITDHDYFDKREYELLQSQTSMILIPAIEYKYADGPLNCQKHLLMYFLDGFSQGSSHQDKINDALNGGALVFIAHPITWRTFVRCLAWDWIKPDDLPRGISGCEIYNERLAQGATNYCPRWCSLNFPGRSAGSDAHALSEYGKFKVWIHAERNLKSVNDALKKGNISLSLPVR